MARNFRTWKRGDPISASRLTEQHRARNTGIFGGPGIDIRQGGESVTVVLQDDRIIPSGGGEGVVGHLEVVIDAVIMNEADCAGHPDCMLPPDGPTFAPHLACFPVMSDGAVDTMAYTRVYPNWGHTLAEFLPVPWDPLNVNQPTFSVLMGTRGWTMPFGEGQKWINPPTNPCQPDGDQVGACCQDDGTCNDTNEGDCPAGIGEWKGPGTSCDDPGICDEGEATGACCDPATGDCTDAQTPQQCEFNNGVYRGDGSICTKGLCPPPGLVGGCCWQGGCINLTPVQCDPAKLPGANWGFAQCDEGTQFSCCFGNTCQALDATCCLRRGGIPAEGFCTPDNPCV